MCSSKVGGDPLVDLALAEQREWENADGRHPGTIHQPVRQTELLFGLVEEPRESLSITDIGTFEEERRMIGVFDR